MPLKGLEWMPREDGSKDHALHTDGHWGTEAPCVVYEKRPLKDPSGKVVDDLFVSWIRLNNPRQYNSYTTEMVKGVIAGMHKGSMERDVMAIVFTAEGDRAFCTGGNTKEYAEYYSKRPLEYVQYMDLFAGMVDAILKARKPVICRCNGMRIAGGQEIGQACDFTVAADTASFGQAGTRHGSTPTGGSTDFLPWNLTMEQAMWQATANEMWSAAKMERLGLITKAVAIKKNDKGEWVRDPRVITDRYVDKGDIVYGEFKTGEAFKEGRAMLKEYQDKADFELLDKEVEKIVWTFANLFPACLIESIDSVRQKKKFFWDTMKNDHRHWLAANMGIEAFLGFGAFNTKKITGVDTIDFIKYRKGVADGVLMDDAFMAEVLGKPQK